MDSQFVKQFLRAMAAGSLLVIAAETTIAGRFFPDEPSRPHTHAGVQPNWGFNQTCWQRFPAIPPCNSQGGCFADSLNPGLNYEQPAAIYTPQSAPVGQDSNYFSQPRSVLPTQVNGLRYAPSQLPPSHNVDSQSLTPVPAVPAPEFLNAAPQQPAPMETMPEPSPVRTNPIPEATPSQLPPLPEPPSSLPSVPDQTRLSPQRLFIRPDGSLTVADNGNMPAPQVIASTRYGRRSPMLIPQQPVSMTVNPIQGVNPTQGTPIHFASGNPSAGQFPASQRYGSVHRHAATLSQRPVSSRVPVQPISESRTGAGYDSRSRYGTPAPAATLSPVPAQQLEPLRSTTGSYR